MSSGLPGNAPACLHVTTTFPASPSSPEPTPFVDTGWEQWREVLAVDLDGPFLCGQRAARRMGAAVDPFTQPRPGVPVGRPGDAREVAAVVALLASPAAAYVTGASWPVDGGMLLMGPQAAALPDDSWRRVEPT
ncbi:SDR family oxidoreductase [Micromonospora thermarum]|uniref:SDR family oxidoreductase n=1 Tax=Micromonospora thermarum TaxID=2720024 RepID=UPI001F1017E7